MKKIKILIVFIFTSLIFYGCQNGPSSIGSALIPNGDLTQVNIWNSSANSANQKLISYKTKIDLGKSGTVLVGRYKQIVSKALVFFPVSMPDSLLTALKSDSLNVLSAWINIYPKYTLGNKSSFFALNVYNILSNWYPYKFDEDSLALLQYDKTNIATMKEVSDSLIKFSISNKIAKQWLQEKIDNNVPKNYGLLLEPTFTTQKIIGFQGLSLNPSNLLPTLYVRVEKPGSFIDTLKASPQKDIHVIEGNPPIVSNSEVLLMDGFVLRGKIWFDVSQIPKGAAINKATLKLFADSTKTFFGSIPSDSIAVEMLQDSTTDSVLTYTYTAFLLRKNFEYSGDISRFVQRWIDQGNNQGAIIRLSDEERALNAVAIFRNNAPDAAKKPQLIIYYTSKN